MRSVGANVSRSTAYRTIRRTKFRYLKKKARPHWKPRHIQVRSQFARVHQTWNLEWRNIIFSDEKKINLDGPDGFKHYWHELGSRYLHYSKRPGGGNSYMVWGAFGFGGCLPLMECRGNMTALRYQDLLQRVNLEDNGELVGGEGFTFQQDNAPIHYVSLILLLCNVFKNLTSYNARSTVQWLRDRHIPILLWPALSPDLNPVENLWAYVSRRVYREGRQFEDLDSLKLAVNEAWGEIDDHLIFDLVDYMKNRMYNVIRNHGGHSTY